MTQLTVEQQLQEQVKDLKSRILDTQDALIQKTQSEQELAGALTEIVKLVGITSETGQVQLIEVINAVKELVESVSPEEDQLLEATE